MNSYLWQAGVPGYTTKTLDKITKDQLIKEVQEAMAKETKSQKAASGGQKGGNRGPGVIATIIETLKAEKPLSKEDILAELVKKFPDRDPEKMKVTVSAQCYRLRKKYQMKIVKGEDKVTRYQIIPRDSEKK